ncbi:hypothetical protein CH263_13380 [Rhodococcus sp. 06-1059B-a]|nr:site-specific DNA-methyltransferase [Rhodococcus sp. 06-1059B-a]OZD65130.1 hypothetical protein CH263_13380 [Rhodococcus sp. 06-1059B-a]
MTIRYQDDAVTLHHGDALEIGRQLETESVDCIVTSPPYYGLRDYDEPGQYGTEATPFEYVERLRALFGELYRVLAKDGTLWLNIGDTYRHKDLLGIPWQVALALKSDGWLLRNAIVWTKPNAMPENVTDRFSNRHELVFLLTRAQAYTFDIDPLRVQYDGDRSPSRRARNALTDQHKQNSAKTAWSGEHQGRNPGDVWEIPTQPFPGAHFATMPTRLAERCIQAGCEPGGTVLDPFSGSGTTGLAAARHGRKYVGIDLNRDYLDLSLTSRLAQSGLDFGVVS